MFVNLFIYNLDNTYSRKDHIEDSLKPEFPNGRTLDFCRKGFVFEICNRQTYL